MTKHLGMTRRHYLAAAGAGVLAAGLGIPRSQAAFATVRQGYQTNIWGMPTYYLLKSGVLEKRGIKFEEFAVPSGNLTMQQMVARQVDMGTYAGQSFIIGHDKGGLVAIAMIEYVGKTAQIVTRKDLNISKVERAQGVEGRQPDRLVGRQHLRRHHRARRGPQEGRFPGGPHERQRHGGRAGRQDRRRHGECRALQRDRGRRRHRQLDHGLLERRPDAGVHGGHARFRRQERRHRGRLSQGLAGGGEDFKDNPAKVADVIYSFFASKGYSMSRTTFAKALARVEVNPGFPSDLQPQLQRDAEVLLREKKISAIPDWKKALRPDLWAKASA